MHAILLSPGALAAARSTAPAASSDPGAALLAAARLLVAGLGCTIEPQTLRNAISAAFGASDAAGAWNWKTVYDACEAARILFLRKFGPAMRKRAASPSAFLVMLEKLAALVPSHTRCSEEGQALQQFSRPIEFGFVASAAAAITSDDLVLEPLPGTWLPPIHAELAGTQLHLNELAGARACLLDQLFGGIGVTRYDAVHIYDHLDGDIHPTVVLMNPPLPDLPPAVITDGLLSDAQLESVIYAGEAHAGYLAGAWMVDETLDVVSAASDDADHTIHFRGGWFLGDGTGAGKGRQVAGILLDNWLKGRRRAVSISKSDKLIQDAQRDWPALGQERLLITPLSRFRPGSPIRLEQGILFTPYATLRSDGREEKLSRVRQIIDWLLRDFDGKIVFDESHAMQNAAGEKFERGERAPSLQGRTGLRLQHALPNARVLYVWATGATTIHNLACAQRLGLWGGADFPFAARAEFVEAIDAGGVAAMEVLARDLKALGLYTACLLSFEGIEYELLEHWLADEQVRIYDTYATAFQVIRNNLNAALQAANVTGESGTLNSQAKSAARSAFESAKQRFFDHLITAMKALTLIAAIEGDLALGRAAVTQIVSTGEALMEPRLAEIPTEEWGNVQVDITLAHGFPTQLYKPFTDGDGNLSSLIGRLVSPAWVAEAVEADPPALAPPDAFAAVLDGRVILQLQDGLELRRVKVMGEFRVELSGFSDGMVERLKAIGLISEIIRLFVPTGTASAAILAHLIERHPLVRLADKAAA